MTSVHVRNTDRSARVNRYLLSEYTSYAQVGATAKSDGQPWEPTQALLHGNRDSDHSATTAKN